MRRFTIIVLALFCLFSLVVLTWFYEGGTDDLLAQYQRTCPFSAREMTYRSASRVLLGQGVVLYQPTFPGLPLKMKTDRVNLKKKGNEIILRFWNVEANISETLRMRDGNVLPDTFRQFAVPDDFFLKPLETLALLNRDVFKGNAELHLRFQGKNVSLTLLIEQSGRPVLTVNTVVWNIPDNRLWGWVNGMIQSADIQINSQSLLSAVGGYYAAIRQPVPVSLKEAISQNKALHIQVNLPQPWPVQNLFSRFWKE